MCGCMYVGMYVCMYVCMYVSISTHQFSQNTDFTQTLPDNVELDRLAVSTPLIPITRPQRMGEVSRFDWGWCATGSR